MHCCATLPTYPAGSLNKKADRYNISFSPRFQKTLLLRSVQKNVAICSACFCFPNWIEETTLLRKFLNTKTEHPTKVHNITGSVPDPHWFQFLFGFRIQHYRLMRLRILFRIQGFDDKNCNKIYIYFLIKIKSTILNLGRHKGHPSYTREAFSNQKRTSSTAWNLFTFSIFVAHFCPPGSGFSLPT